MNRDLHFDYTTLGHVTVDVMPDGSRRAGGTAFYSALQAARLGLSARIVTRGRPAEVAELLAPYAAELTVETVPAESTTTLLTEGSGTERRQRLLAWAGPFAPDPGVDTAILHLAPVARETPDRWRGRADFVGLTPQGLARRWSEPRGEITLGRGLAGYGLSPESVARLADACNAIVVSDHERAACGGLIEAAARAGTLVAITAGAEPNTVVLPSGAVLELEVPMVADPVDDLGAGDVFAAALFVTLHEGRAPAESVAFANAAAAVRMAGVGADAVGVRAQVEARLAELAARRSGR